MIYKRLIAFVGMSFILAILSSAIFAPFLFTIINEDDINTHQIQKISSTDDLFLFYSPSIVEHEDFIYLLGISTSKIGFLDSLGQYQNISSNTPITIVKRDFQWSLIWEAEITTNLNQWYSNQSIIRSSLDQIVAIDDKQIIISNNRISNDNLSINQTYSQDDFFQIITEFQILSTESGEYKKSIFISHLFNKINLTNQVGFVRYFEGMITHDTIFVPFESYTSGFSLGDQTITIEYGYITYDLITENTQIISIDTISRGDSNYWRRPRVNEIILFENSKNTNILEYRIDLDILLDFWIINATTEIITYSIDISDKVFTHELTHLSSIYCWAVHLCNQRILSQDAHIFLNITDFEGAFMTFQIDKFQLKSTEFVDHLEESRNFSINSSYYVDFRGPILMDSNVVILPLWEFRVDDFDNDGISEFGVNPGIAYQILGNENATIVDFDFLEIDKERDYRSNLNENLFILAIKTTDGSYIFISHSIYTYFSNDVFSDDYTEYESIIAVYLLTIKLTPNLMSFTEKTIVYGIPFTTVFVPATIVSGRKFREIRRSYHENDLEIYPEL